MPLLFALLFTLSLHDQSVLTIPKVEATQKTWTPEEVRSLATSVAKEYGLKTQKFIDTIQCESNWDVYAEGDYLNNDGSYVTKKNAQEGAEPTSFGVAQWHPTAHADKTDPFYITKEQALDPVYSLNLMAKAWDENHANWWSCWHADAPLP